MSSLAEMMAKARRAVMRRGVSAADADELVHDAFIKVEQYERAHAAESQEALLVTAAVNLSIDRARRNRRAPFAAHDDLQAIADGAPAPGQIVAERAPLAHAPRGPRQLPQRTPRITPTTRPPTLPFPHVRPPQNHDGRRAHNQ